MMVSTSVRHQLRRASPRVHALGQTVLWAGVGILSGAASLGQACVPLSLGLLCACEGWQAVMAGLGGMVGYLLFWGDAGIQGILWMALGMAVTLPLGGRRLARSYPMLMPAFACLIVSAGGVLFQVRFGDDTSIPVYLLRVGLAGISCRVFLALEEDSPLAQWLAGALAVLALAQVAPHPWLNLGMAAAAALAVREVFPAAALAGAALDLSGVSPLPGAGVMSLAYLVRMVPGIPRQLTALAPALCGVFVMQVWGKWDLHALPGLALGGILAAVIPRFGPDSLPRRGETGAAQVQLELASEVLHQSEALLRDTETPRIDLDALALKAGQQACAGCPCRKACHDTRAVQELPGELLTRPLLRPEALPVSCKKSGRVLAELRRSQEQLRSIRAARVQVGECREAVLQQYQFLAGYLQSLSDRLARRDRQEPILYRAQVAGCTTGREEADGDRCAWFAGPEGTYFILLCDGMGTGFGAARESRDACRILRKMLAAGYPAESALRSVNNLCALRGQAGAVTMDLCQAELSTGKVMLYKWGAAPSYLLTARGTEKIGTADPPPGLSVADGQETADRLSLSRGETLILLSDGVDGEIIQRRAWELEDRTAGEVAAGILKLGRGDGTDDATAVVIRLVPEAMST